jgi:O-glycosyl hydrolase
MHKISITALLLITALVFLACGVTLTQTEKIFDAQTPTVTESTQSFFYKIGDTLPALSVTAEVTDGGELTYQWYEYDFEKGIGEIIDGEEDDSFSPPAITQERQGRPYRYYVDVINTNRAATGRKQVAVSVVIDITAYDENNAQAPRITRQPAGGSFSLSSRMAIGISVSADTGDGGTISYQWYRANSTIAEHGTPIEGATSSGLNLTRGLFDEDAEEAEGTYYFFVVATNTNTRVPGRRETQTISDVVTVTITLSPNAAQPEILAQPQGMILFVGDELSAADAVSIDADSEDGGEISFQWYRNTRSANSGGAVIAGAIKESYKLSDDSNFNTDASGSYYYYVVVTNTNDAATVNKVTTITSDVAKITVQDTDVPEDDPGIYLDVLLDKKYQYVRGFGGMDVAWANFPTYTMEDYENMYNPDRLGYNMLRIMIPPNYTDINRTMEELVANKISGAMDRSNYYEFVKLVNKYGGYVLASPWTPPAAWKSNNSVNGGGELRPANYQDFADYLRTYAQIMADHGAPIYVVALQNEPTWVAGYDGCEYTPQQNRDFFLKVGHFIKNSGGKPAAPVPGYGGGKAQPWVRTMGGESHNEIQTFHEPAMRNKISRDAIDIIGAHIYGAGPRRYSMAPLTDTEGSGDWTPTGAWNPTDWRPVVQNGTGTDGTDAKEIWMTEHNINGGNAEAYKLDSSWEYVWKFMNDVDLVIRHNQENAFIWWSSKRFYSMIGDGSYATTDGAILPRGYGLSHYARFAKETGMIGVEASGYLKDDTTKVSVSNVNNIQYTNDDTSAKITAYVTLKDPDKNWRKDRDTITLADISAISLIMYTPTNAGAAGTGYDLGNVKVKLPDGFIIRDAILMRSTANVKQQMESVVIDPDRNRAYINLPRSNIVSVRFTKQ